MIHHLAGIEPERADLAPLAITILRQPIGLALEDRAAGGFDTARAEILRCSGTQFDPAVVEAFLKIPNELWYELRAEINGQARRYTTADMAAEALARQMADKQ